MNNNWLFVKVHYIVIIYYIITSYCQLCLGGPDSPDKQNFNKKIKINMENLIVLIIPC